jgi:hypothetical protein
LGIAAAEIFGDALRDAGEHVAQGRHRKAALRLRGERHGEGGQADG